MRDRLFELKDKRHELLARYHAVEAQDRVVGAVTALNAADPTNEISRFEDGVRRRETLAQGRAEVAAASLESRFDELDEFGKQMVVQDRLALLKDGKAPALSIEPAKTEQ